MLLRYREQSFGDVGDELEAILWGRIGQIEDGAVAVLAKMLGEGMAADPADISGRKDRDVEVFLQRRELAIGIQEKLLDAAERLLEEAAQQHGFAGAAVALDQQSAVDQLGEVDANGFTLRGIADADIAGTKRTSWCRGVDGYDVGSALPGFVTNDLDRRWDPGFLGKKLGDELIRWRELRDLIGLGEHDAKCTADRSFCGFTDFGIHHLRSLSDPEWW
ncbi:hypothetical protein GGQ99_004765 [Aminobacter niigataensis]|uniref:Uncharacterized protein n=1 Tax=Aminobacter niigataensis TaxID=83265 RepID=A0ABR6LAK2_9HYPH|nr:hypothetical protein [Aminobacter niigataensis]MBB4652981.1 hypothetical protein [Aminobacter niigataensis]